MTEIIILGICPIPFVDCYIYSDGGTNVYFLSEILLALMSFRFYFIMRTWLNQGEYSDTFSVKLCKSYGVESGMKFSLKCLYQTKTEGTVTLLFVWTIIIFSYLVRIFEVPAYRNLASPSFDSYFNSVWFTVITLTTTGYGDLYP